MKFNGAKIQLMGAFTTTARLKPNADNYVDFMQMCRDWRDVNCAGMATLDGCYVGHQARLGSCVFLYCLVQRELVRAWGHLITLGLSLREIPRLSALDERKRQVVLDCLDG